MSQERAQREARPRRGRAASRRRAKPNRSSAFTLIEIMAVVIIIGLLTGLVGTMVFRQVDKARVATTQAEVSSLEGILELYHADNGRFPTTEQGLEALLREPTTEPMPRNYQPGGYLKGGRVPLDAWGEPYHYESPGQHNPHYFDLWSYGADGVAGGEGVDADIGNWEDTGA